ncbi:MAG: cellulase family glycosylhydrolase [Opitutaceae bacterium]|nr:cellulase family glycosylhydrolase [Cytophagales bacterium]
MKQKYLVVSDYFKSNKASMKYIYQMNYTFRFWIFLVTSLVLSLSSKAQLPTAQQTANAMTIGWNIGNSMEAMYLYNGAMVAGENAWGNPNISQTLIDSVKAAGFNTIRIPIAWDVHANPTTHVIDAAWIARVKQVVDYCIKRNMYVVINIHWDNGWLEKNVTQASQIAVNVKQKDYWTQIANYFKAYDGHLLFASANEPDVSDATGMAVLLSYHQTFINAVRATGGNNSSRVLVIQGPSTDIEKSNTLMNTMPTDQIANRIIVEVHYYTPYNFCLMTEDATWGKQFYYWGKNNHSATDVAHNPTYGEEADVDKLFGYMKTKFVDKGYPVIIGEFAAIKRTGLTGAALALHIKSRLYFYEYISNAACKNNLKLIYWDAGNLGNNSMTLFDRTSGARIDRDAINALMKGTCLPVVTSISQIMEENSEIKYYPNPFNNNLQIEGNSQIIKVMIFDMLGNLAETKVAVGLDNHVQLGESLKPGSYFVQVHSAEKQKTFKVLKR